jgi:two-component system LytT family sensor kinase
MESPYSFGAVYTSLMSFFFLIDVLVYWTVLAVGHAVDFYRKYRDGEAQLARAKLQALRMQLHPHFLFNTLNAIATLVRQQQNRAATDMIAGLSDLLRLTLENDGGQEVPLKQELDVLDRYLSIEQIRFGDRLRVDVDATPETLRARVPNLVLQPLVENAILHGIAPRSTPGRIVIRAERADGRLRLQVRDDGPGFPDGSPAMQGVGLRNTAARLQHLYGPDHRIAFANAPEGGAVITLELPFHIDEPVRP